MFCFCCCLGSNSSGISSNNFKVVKGFVLILVLMLVVVILVAIILRVQYLMLSMT